MFQGNVFFRSVFRSLCYSQIYQYIVVAVLSKSSVFLATKRGTQIQKLYYMKLFIKFCFFVLLVSCFASCTNDYQNNVLASDKVLPGEKSAMLKAVTALTYYSTPTVGGFVPNSSSSITLNGSCGKATGGILKAQLLSKSGNTYTAKLSLQTLFPYINVGNAYIKANAICGDIAGSAFYSSMANLSDYVNVSFTPSFTQGVQHFYPLIISGSYREYAEPILIYTTPMYNTTWTYGNVLGTVDGVEVRCNGSTNLSTASNAYYQCTEFCARYYLQVYGKTEVAGGNARTWYSNAANKKLTPYPNKGSKAPRPGDILCMDGNTYGHVAIIIEVGSTYIKIAQQNTGTNGGVWAPIGAQLTYNATTKEVTAPSGYSIQGWLRYE